jgi:hypothetical protein
VLGGVALLARGKTLGVLLAPLACLAQVALVVTMTRAFAQVLSAVLLAPGLILAIAATVAYSAPIWRFVRGR